MKEYFLICLTLNLIHPFIQKKTSETLVDSIIDCKTQYLISKFISITLSIKFELGNKQTD